MSASLPVSALAQGAINIIDSNNLTERIACISSTQVIGYYSSHAGMYFHMVIYLNPQDTGSSPPLNNLAISQVARTPCFTTALAWMQRDWEAKKMIASLRHIKFISLRR
uniref:hypothetical protein n=1 Tax=Cellvibrio fontiphilus TaxID=1815559 RepID=UPI002B4C02D8|nr:hypothetical protein [Cellvibrio fontiphilus]